MRLGRWTGGVDHPFWSGADGLAERGQVWAAVGAVLVTRKGVWRRAGVRATTAAAATSAMVHAVAQPLLPRVHPAAGRFPSSRAATATAFAVATAMESPVIGAVVAPLAATVAVARVRLGDRHPAEVAGGVALGAGLALLTRRWWPVYRGEPARARPARGAPALGDGAGLVVVANSAAGTAAGQGGGPDIATEVAATLPRAQIVVAEPGVDFVAEIEAALDRPSLNGEGPRAIGVAGGDGSVAALAGVAERRGVPLVVIPAGTLNHFARDVGIADSAAALDAARDGDAVLVDVGMVVCENARYTFVNTASLGGYPDMVRLREGWQGRFGKWPAAALALSRVLAEASPLVVRIHGRPRTIWLLFVGNGIYHPRGMAPLFRPRLDGRVLDVRYLRADVPFSRTRFLVAALVGALHRSRVLVAEQRRTLDVQIVGDPVALATDGEVQPDARRFRFAVGPVPVPVYRPDAES